MGLPDLPDLAPCIHALRTAAEHCYDEAASLHARAQALTWDGASGDAVRHAAAVQVRALRLVARELEISAGAVAAHRAASTAMINAALAVGPGAMLSSVVGVIEVVETVAERVP